MPGTSCLAHDMNLAPTPRKFAWLYIQGQYILERYEKMKPHVGRPLELALISSPMSEWLSRSFKLAWLGGLRAFYFTHLSDFTRFPSFIPNNLI